MRNAFHRKNARCVKLCGICRNDRLKAAIAIPRLSYPILSIRCTVNGQSERDTLVHHLPLLDIYISAFANAATRSRSTVAWHYWQKRGAMHWWLPYAYRSIDDNHEKSSQRNVIFQKRTAESVVKLRWSIITIVIDDNRVLDPLGNDREAVFKIS